MKIGNLEIKVWQMALVALIVLMLLGLSFEDSRELILQSYEFLKGLN